MRCLEPLPLLHCTALGKTPPTGLVFLAQLGTTETPPQRVGGLGLSLSHTYVYVANGTRPLQLQLHSELPAPVLGAAQPGAKAVFAE